MNNLNQENIFENETDDLSHAQYVVLCTLLGFTAEDEQYFEDLATKSLGGQL